MSNLMIKFVNAETGEEVERPMNATELTQYQAEQAAHVDKLAAQEAATTAKAALLERLGITADEAALLLS